MHEHRDRIADLQLRGNTRPLTVRVCWPSAGPQPVPLLVFCMVGVGAEATGPALSSAAGLVVLTVSCEPVSRDPVSRDGAGTIVLEWAAEHAAELGADPGRLLVAGEGAGAVVAAAVALRAGEQGWPVITRQVLINPAPIGWPAAAGVAPATVVTVSLSGPFPGGDDGHYAARLREAGVTVDELRCAIPDLVSGKMLADLGRTLRRSLARYGSDESGPPPTSFSTNPLKEE